MPTLEFKGKPFVYSHHLSVPFRELVIDPKKSLPAKGQKPSLDDNLVIHGDNLEALKALLPRYAGKVDVIYIDPPYNTGNEGWAYNDNVNSPLMKEWLGKVVDRDDLERHDKWCCMMWPRLQLLEELLAPDGVFYASIGRDELQNLIAIGLEIFGDKSLIRTIPVIRNLKGNNDEYAFAGTLEYLVVFRKGDTEVTFGEFELDEEESEDWLEDEIGPYKKGANLKATGNNAPREKRQNLFFPIYVAEDLTWSLERRSKNDSKILPITDGKEMSWRWGRKRFADNPDDVIVEKSDKQISLYKKQRPSLGDLPSKKPKDIFYKPSYSTTTAMKEIKEIFGSREFETPKALSFIRDLIFLKAKNSLILDSFAGSGTTAHATLSLNSEDGGGRKFLLIEAEGYTDKITAERIRRVINGVPKAKSETLRDGLAGSFTFCNLGEALDLERFFDGRDAPSYEQVGRYVVYTATGQSAADTPKEPRKDWFVGEAGGYRIHLIYKPDLEFMRGSDASLSMPLAKEISKGAKGKPVLVYAAAKFMSQAELTRLGITFCQLPYSVHRVLGEAPDAS